MQSCKITRGSSSGFGEHTALAPSKRWPRVSSDTHQVTARTPVSRLWGVGHRPVKGKRRRGIIGQLETVLAELTRFEDDFDGRRDVPDRACFALMHRPALGGQLVARLCAAEEDAVDLEPLSELLGAALDAARMAKESGKKRGDAFQTTVTDAVELAARQGRLSPVHRLILARIWARNGLTAPVAL